MRAFRDTLKFFGLLLETFNKNFSTNHSLFYWARLGIVLRMIACSSLAEDYDAFLELNFLSWHLEKKILLRIVSRIHILIGFFTSLDKDKLTLIVLCVMQAQLNAAHLATHNVDLRDRLLIEEQRYRCICFIELNV